MRYLLRNPHIFLMLLLGTSFNQSFAQLFYEGMVFDGMNKPLLENASSVDISPDGQFVYATSFDDNAVTVYTRDIGGSPGALTFVESVKNEVNGVYGLQGAYHLKISPDGNHVYVASSLDDALTVFSRDVVSGTLTYLTTYWNNVGGVEGISGAYFVDMPVDGNHVYVAGPDENAVAVFERNVLTGELGFVQMIQDESGDVTEMNYPLALNVSPNGKHVYVTSFGDQALNVFERDLVSGELEFVEFFKEGSGGVSGLISAYAPYVTPDGNHVYVTGLDSDGVVVFSRDNISGELEYVDTYIDGSNGVDGISGPTTMSASANGEYLFVAGSNEDAVAIFQRNTTSGTLSFLSMVQQGVSGVSGIAYPTYLKVSEDGANLYVTGFASASIGVFSIDEVAGNLNFQSAETGAGLGISGLDGNAAVAVSPDGNFVYAAGNNDDAIVVFERDDVSGMLTFVQEIEDASATDGLNGINGIAISADGNYVYTTGFWDKTIVLFTRNPNTGMLTYVERWKDGLQGVDGLNGANYVTISPDGNNVYVTSFWDNAVAVFDVGASGSLTFREVHKDGSLGVDGLSRASGIVITQDGSHAYVAGNNDNAIAIFQRASDGSLTYQGAIKDGVNGIDGIQRITSVAVNLDGTQVYGTGQNDDALAIFNRDAMGNLTFHAQMKNGVGDVEGMDGPSRMTMSNDGSLIYVTAENSDALVAFRVLGDSLTFEGSQKDSDMGVNGLDGAEFVAVTPDGKHMYVAASIDDAISIFSCTYVLDTKQTICEGDSVVVGANVYKASGVYVDTFSFGACKSVTTLELEVQPAMTEMSVELCNGDVYTYDGNQYNSTGVYTFDFTSAKGCDSTVVIDLTVVNQFSTTEEVVNICQGESYMWGGQEYTTSGSYSETFTSSFGCDSTVMLDLTVDPTYDQVLDVEICEGEFYILGTQNYIATGTYVETFASSTGCDSTITLNLIVFEPESVVNATICDGDTYTIGNNSFTESGSYAFTLESNIGCEDSEVTLHLVVLQSSEESLVETICEGQSYSVGDETYNTSGVYTQVFTAVNGCDSTITLDLTVVPTMVTLNETICEGESYTVGTTTYTTTGQHTTTLAGTAGCGDSTVVLNLVVESTQQDIAATICDGETYTLGTSTYTTTGVYTQSATSDAGCLINYTLNLTVADNYEMNVNASICEGGSVEVAGETFTEVGQYTVDLSSTAGCDSTIMVNVSLADPIEADDMISWDENSSTGAIDLTVNGGQAPYTFNWSNGMVTEDITDLPAGEYTVTVTDANGCTMDFSFMVDQSSSTFDIGQLVEVTLFPNPAPVGATASMAFSISERQNLRIQLFDSTGKLIHADRQTFFSGASSYELPLPKVQGLYQVVITTESGVFKSIPVSVK